MQWSFPFLAPVDTTKYLDYLTVVKQPMDLGSIKQRLESGGYRDPQVRRQPSPWGMAVAGLWQRGSSDLILEPFQSRGVGVGRL